MLKAGSLAKRTLDLTVAGGVDAAGERIDAALSRRVRRVGQTREPVPLMACLWNPGRTVLPMRRHFPLTCWRSAVGMAGSA